MPTPTYAEALRALGLRRGCSFDEAKASYRRLALRHHPDRNPGADAAAFQRISAAFEVVAKTHDARDGEVAAILDDPLADFFGEGWARAFAEGTRDPEATFAHAQKQAQQQHVAAGHAAADDLGADLGDAAVLEIARELGLRGTPAELRAMLGSADAPSPAGSLLDSLGAGGGRGGGREQPADLPEGANAIRDFFGAMPEGEREGMIDLFDRTFPAFLAEELQQQQEDVEAAVFARAVERDLLRPEGSGRDGAARGECGAGGGSGAAATSAEAEAEAERHNAAGVAAFGAGDYSAAAAHLTRAISADPRNAALYGNRRPAQSRTVAGPPWWWGGRGIGLYQHTRPRVHVAGLSRSRRSGSLNWRSTTRSRRCDAT